MSGTSSRASCATLPQPSASSAPPLYATPRNPTRPTEGPQIAAVARRLGTPLTPMQQHIADVATERRPDGSYEYQVVVVSVPRQTGKTTLLRAVGTHRCLVCRRDVFYTAQTGKDARERWMDLVKLLRVNPALRDRVTVGLRGGSEQIGFPGGAAFRVFAPTVESLHGYTPPTVMLDEAFALSGMDGDLLMAAIGPAQFTITDRQLWIVSTAGTAESTFLHDWIDRGMEGAPRVACFVWGARDDQDPFDLDDVAAFHPGVGQLLNGRLLTAADVVAQADAMSRAEYERAFANRRTITTRHLIPAEVWRDLGVELSRPHPSELVLTYDVAADRQSAAIVASWLDDDGRPTGMVVRAGPGTSWLAPAVRELRDSWRPAAIGAVAHGPVLAVTEQLRDQVPELVELGERDYATACGRFLSLVDDEQLRHDGGELLATSVAGLVTRPAVSDGVAFSRRHSVGDSSPAIALVAGLFLAGQQARRMAAPVVRFG